jgi:glucokinase
MQEQPDNTRTAFADGPRLLADIGATHARFALQTAPGTYRSVRVSACSCR